VHFLQIWIEPSQREIAPGYEQARVDDEAKRGRLALIAGPAGSGTAVTIHQDARLYATRRRSRRTERSRSRTPIAPTSSRSTLIDRLDSLRRRAATFERVAVQTERAGADGCDVNQAARDHLVQAWHACKDHSGRLRANRSVLRRVTAPISAFAKRWTSRARSLTRISREFRRRRTTHSATKLDSDQDGQTRHT
jgi:hypothetical protein